MGAVAEIVVRHLPRGESLIASFASHQSATCFILRVQKTVTGA